MTRAVPSGLRFRRPAGSCRRPRTPRRGAGPALLALLALLGILHLARPAAALETKPGQEVALGISSAFAAGSAVSIVGNSVYLAKGKPSRAWLITGYFFGTMNMVISPLLLVYGREPDAAFGLGVGAMHGAIGIANFVLSVYGGVLWRRQAKAEEAAGQKTARLPSPQLSLVPLAGRDSLGGSFAGVGLSVSRF